MRGIIHVDDAPLFHAQGALVSLDCSAVYGAKGFTKPPTWRRLNDWTQLTARFDARRNSSEVRPDHTTMGKSRSRHRVPSRELEVPKNLHRLGTGCVVRKSGIVARRRERACQFTSALRLFRGSMRTFFEAGFALNIIVSLVKGLMP